jgi:diacylglycerol kinase (ATP)
MDTVRRLRTDKVAVVAHRKKAFGPGLPGLRTLLRDVGVQPQWYEVGKSRKAPAKVRKALRHGAELVFVWGGDGMVQRCVDALAGSTTAIAILPAGTANLFATNLGIPRDLAEAVRIGLYGQRRRLDLGKVNGEHFAVMAGVGFDGEMINDATGSLKRRAGRLAYLWSGLQHVRDGAVPMTIRVDGRDWFDGRASCVLVGNVAKIGGGIRAFDDARPDDGWIDVGVATAEGAWQWARTLGRMAVDRSERSPLVRVTRAKTLDVRLGAPMTYELDGGARDRTDRIRASVVEAAVTVCVPGA